MQPGLGSLSPKAGGEGGGGGLYPEVSWPQRALVQADWSAGAGGAERDWQAGHAGQIGQAGLSGHGGSMPDRYSTAAASARKFQQQQHLPAPQYDDPSAHGMSTHRTRGTGGGGGPGAAGEAGGGREGRGQGSLSGQALAWNAGRRLALWEAMPLEPNGSPGSSTAGVSTPQHSYTASTRNASPMRAAAYTGVGHGYGYNAGTPSTYGSEASPAAAAAPAAAGATPTSTYSGVPWSAASAAAAADPLCLDAVAAIPLDPRRASLGAVGRPHPQSAHSHHHHHHHHHRYHQQQPQLHQQQADEDLLARGYRGAVGIAADSISDASPMSVASGPWPSASALSAAAAVAVAGAVPTQHQVQPHHQQEQQQWQQQKQQRGASPSPMTTPSPPSSPLRPSLISMSPLTHPYGPSAAHAASATAAGGGGTGPSSVPGGHRYGYGAPYTDVPMSPRQRVTVTGAGRLAQVLVSPGSPVRLSPGGRRGGYTGSPAPGEDEDEEEGEWWRDMYHIDWWPKELFFKFRHRFMKYRIGANVELRRPIPADGHSMLDSPRVPQSPRGNGVSESASSLTLWGFQASSVNVKLVVKPAGDNGQWKILVEPQRGDVRFLTRKINVLGLFNVQVGVGHDFRNNATGWKWKVTSAVGGAASAGSSSPIAYKYTLPVCPGFDARVGCNADYVLPDLHGSVGTGEPLVGLNVGRLYASVERFEAIFTRLD